ncbi:hypothetical protein N0V93_009841 [Gnomoniopsis smithogilvyi]|uniref:Uncharacterized protein n=1 Tax=Gnomoniopsis smithogilvyi TaxID=1191159 RepID=A0A9W8YKU8_9PEZI|nr:hypothetical protein N0V93_009841 [Gnomoniopsis smithogilvyi]
MTNMNNTVEAGKKPLMASLFDNDFKVKFSMNSSGELKKLANQKNNTKRADDLAVFHEDKKRKKAVAGSPSGYESIRDENFRIDHNFENDFSNHHSA